MAIIGVVLPTYNEADNLPRLVERLEGLYPPQDIHIFVVDDSSPDGTSGVAQELASQYGNMTLISRPRKLGLGSALREGMAAALAAACTYILTMDADLSHRPEDAPRLLEVAQNGSADLVQGSRYAPGGEVAQWSWWRRLQSHGANLLCRGLLGCPREATTNFRIFNRRSAQMVVEKSKGRDFEFQPESILIAMRHGLRIVEVPILFSGRAHGRSKLGAAQYVRWVRFFIVAFFAYRLRIGRSSRVDSTSPPESS